MLIDLIIFITIISLGDYNFKVVFAYHYAFVMLINLIIFITIISLGDYNFKVVLLIIMLS